MTEVEDNVEVEISRSMIVTVYDSDIPKVIEALRLLPFLPEHGLLKLGVFDVHNVKHLTRYDTQYSEELDDVGNCKFLTLTLDYTVLEE